MAKWRNNGKLFLPIKDGWMSWSAGLGEAQRVASYI